MFIPGPSRQLLLQWREVYAVFTRRKGELVCGVTEKRAGVANAISDTAQVDNLHKAWDVTFLCLMDGPLNVILKL